MRFLTLLCLVGCALLVNSESAGSGYAADLEQEIVKHILENRDNFATGFEGKLPSLEPIEIKDSFSFVATSPIAFRDTITHAIFKGFTTFDNVSVHLTSNNSFVLKIHVPEVELAGAYHHVPTILGVSTGAFSSTLNDAELTISGEFITIKGAVPTIPQFKNIRVDIDIGAPTTNIQIHGKDITKQYVEFVVPLLGADIGSFLKQASNTYQTQVSQFVTNYLNRLHKILA